MNKRTEAFIILTVLAIIWGSSFILMKKGLDVYSPFQIGALRMLVSFAVMLPFLFGHFRKIEKSKWKYLALAGLLGNGLPSILFPLAETNVGSALAGMINSLTPIFTLIIGMIFYQMKGGRNRIAGLVIGLIGAILLVSGKSEGAMGGNTSYEGYIVIATIFYACSVNILRHNLSELDSVRTTGFALMFAGIPMGSILFTTDFIHRSTVVPGSGFSLFYIVILGLFGTAISTVMFNRLIKISGALSASSVTYLIPVVALGWGVLDKEHFGILHVAGLVAILCGVYLINKKTS